MMALPVHQYVMLHVRCVLPCALTPMHLRCASVHRAYSAACALLPAGPGGVHEPS